MLATQSTSYEQVPCGNMYTILTKNDGQKTTVVVWLPGSGMEVEDKPWSK
jgi:hypothetical protein